MSILSRDEIKRRCNFHALVEPCEDGLIKSASYDLRLGNEYYVYNKKDELSNVFSTKPLGPTEKLVIPAGEVCYLITKEKINMPNDLVGNISLSFGLVGQGLMLSKQPPIDPGYSGRIACMIHNLSSNSVILACETHILTIEFHKLDRPITDRQWLYRGRFQNLKSLDLVVKGPIYSPYHKLLDDFWLFRSSVIKFIPIVLSIFAIVVTIIVAIPSFKSVIKTPPEIYAQDKILFIKLNDGKLITINTETVTGTVYGSDK